MSRPAPAQRQPACIANVPVKLNHCLYWDQLVAPSVCPASLRLARHVSHYYSCSQITRHLTCTRVSAGRHCTAAPHCLVLVYRCAADSSLTAHSPYIAGAIPHKTNSLVYVCVQCDDAADGVSVGVGVVPGPARAHPRRRRACAPARAGTRQVRILRTAQGHATLY